MFRNDDSWQGNDELPFEPQNMDMFGTNIGNTEKKKRKEIERRKKRGECPSCGRKTHKVHFTGKKTALTVEGEVLYGQCLRCNPIEGYLRRPPQPAIPTHVQTHEDDSNTVVSGLTMDQSMMMPRGDRIAMDFQSSGLGDFEEGDDEQDLDPLEVAAGLDSPGKKVPPAFQDKDARRRTLLMTRGGDRRHPVPQTSSNMKESATSFNTGVAEVNESRLAVMRDADLPIIPAGSFDSRRDPLMDRSVMDLYSSRDKDMYSSREVDFHGSREMDFHGSREMDFHGSREMDFHGSREMNLHGVRSFRSRHLPKTIEESGGSGSDLDASGSELRPSSSLRQLTEVGTSSPSGPVRNVGRNGSRRDLTRQNNLSPQLESAMKVKDGRDFVRESSNRGFPPLPFLDDGRTGSRRDLNESQMKSSLHGGMMGSDPVELAASDERLAMERASSPLDVASCGDGKNDDIRMENLRLCPPNIPLHLEKKAASDRDFGERKPRRESHRDRPLAASLPHRPSLQERSPGRRSIHHGEMDWGEIRNGTSLTEAPPSPFDSDRKPPPVPLTHVRKEPLPPHVQGGTMSRKSQLHGQNENGESAVLRPESKGSSSESRSNSDQILNISLQELLEEEQRNSSNHLVTRPESEPHEQSSNNISSWMHENSDIAAPTLPVSKEGGMHNNKIREKGTADMGRWGQCGDAQSARNKTKSETSAFSNSGCESSQMLPAGNSVTLRDDDEDMILLADEAERKKEETSSARERRNDDSKKLLRMDDTSGDVRVTKMVRHLSSARLISSSPSVQSRKTLSKGKTPDSVSETTSDLSSESKESDDLSVMRPKVEDVPLILNCLKLYPSYALLHQRAYEALKVIATEPEQKGIISIGMNRGVQAIVAGMWAMMDNATVQFAALNALWVIAAAQSSSSHGNMTFPRDSGVMDALLIAMQTHLENLPVQHVGCGAISCLASSQEGNSQVEDGTSSILSVVNAMDMHQTSSDVQEWGIRALYAICELSDANKIIFTQNNAPSGYIGGGVDAVYHAMKAAFDELGIQEWACRLYWCLSSIDEAAASMSMNDKPIQAIVDALKTFIRRENAVVLNEAACGALANLSALVDQNQTRILRTGGVAALIDAMLFHQQSERVQVEACAALANLAVTRDARERILKRRGVGAVLSAMEAFAESSSVQAEACRVLYCLCIDMEEAKEALSSDVAVSTIVRVLGMHESSVYTLEMACGVLASLAVYEANQFLIVSSGGLSAVVQAMKAHSREENLQAASCSVLRNLSAHWDNHDDFVVCGAVNIIIRSMHAHSKTAELQENACSTFWNLAANRNFDISAMFEAGAVKYIVKAMQTLPESIAVQEIGCGALWNLSEGFDDRKSHVASAGGVDAIICAIVMYPTELGLLEKACGALSSLSVEQDNASAISSAGGISAVIDAMRDNVSSVVLMERGCLLLRNLTTVNPADADEVVSGVTTILRGMTGHPDAVGLQREACGALWSLALHSERCKDRILAADGIDVIVNCMEHNDCVSEIQENGREAFAQLMG